MTAGYSATPLLKKLGIKPGYRVALLNAPEGYLDWLGELPADVTLDQAFLPESCDFAQAFFVWRADCAAALPMLKRAIKKDGMLWISWYKRAAKMPTDIKEDLVRELALQAGLVDVKVAAIDAQWSGLKLVYRLKDR